jgi:hypothetical protein
VGGHEEMGKIEIDEAIALVGTNESGLRFQKHQLRIIESYNRRIQFANRYFHANRIEGLVIVVE